MPKALSASEVTALSEDGDHYVARNLWIQIRDDGKTKSWVIRYQLNGRLKRMGIGPYRLVNYSTALGEAGAAQQLLLKGKDPMAERDAALRPISVTFEEATKAYITAHEAGWSNAKHSHQVRAHLETYAYPVIGKLMVRQIDANDVVKILTPLWTDKHETGTRVRSRIEAVLDWAKSAGYRSGDNPAALKGNLQHRLPPTSRMAKVEHHVAIPLAVAQAVFGRLAAIETRASKALRFIALTGVRYSEGAMATWAEFDLDAKVWMLPAERAKARKPHRVPLSAPAVAILRSLWREGTKPERLVFHGPDPKRPVSDTRLRGLLREVCDVPKVTTHGWRSTLRDWAAEQTTFAPMVAEAALQHSLGTKVEVSYLRTDLFEQRQKMMTAWAKFLTGLSV